MAGYVDKIRRKNDDEFVPMSAAAGVKGGDGGVFFAGEQYRAPGGTLVGAINQLTPDVFNTLFAKVEHPFQLADERSLKAFLQSTDQRRVGDDLIGTFDTSLLSGKLEFTAGSTTRLVGVTHDFGRIGPGKLSFFANVVGGDTTDRGPNASPDETEYDLAVDYRFDEGWGDTLWLRVRGACVDQDERTGGDEFFDFRIIVNYSFDPPRGGH